MRKMSSEVFPIFSISIKSSCILTMKKTSQRLNRSFVEIVLWFSSDVFVFRLIELCVDAKISLRLTCNGKLFLLDISEVFSRSSRLKVFTLNQVLIAPYEGHKAEIWILFSVFYYFLFVFFSF